MRGTERDEGPDFLRCVFILLMVAFHLAGFADRHPVLKSFVYTFHMPGFLLLSGWFTAARVPASAFLRRVAWVAVPYAVMETGYVVAASVLPVREQAGPLTPLSLLLRLVWNPLGPYWYLHTWVICQTVCFLLVRWMPRAHASVRLAAAAVPVVLLSWHCPVFGLANALYYLAGWTLRESGVPLRRAFPPVAWQLPLLLLLCACPSQFDKNLPGGCALVWCVVSLLLRLSAVPAVRSCRAALFVGRNTLPVLLFSPVFTMAAKWFQPWFAADGSGTLFMLAGTSLSVSGSLAVAWLSDRTGVSRFFFGRPRVLR